MICYFGHRALRILYPLVLTALASVFPIDPLFSDLRVAAYFQHPMAWQYLGAAGKLWSEGALPGVFRVSPVGGINGSRWLMHHLVVLYLITLPLGRPKLLKSLVLIPYALSCFGPFQTIARCRYRPGELTFGPQPSSRKSSWSRSLPPFLVR